ncbi:DinB family protein [Candidatus Sumerlaeota bacterium]|nr:DinB family protein [Candidatus Sumerlaeota bacterium]
MIIVRRELLNLGRSYQRMEEILRWDDKVFYAVREKVSLWSPAQHLWHIGMTNDELFRRIDTLFRDEAPEILRKGGPVLRGRITLLVGRIPRGRIPAASHLIPQPEVDRNETLRVVHGSKRNFTNCAAKGTQLHAVTGRLAHPVLGALNAEEWLRFANVHTCHHLRIVDRISKTPHSGT